MIEIITTYSVKPDSSATDINIIKGICKEYYDVLYETIQPLIAGNVILNSVTMRTENNQLVMSHFATAPEKAQIYIDTNSPATSFWDHYGIEFTIEQKEIDFDTVDPTTINMIIDDNNVLYTLKD
jgi:hypothetical protein